MTYKHSPSIRTIAETQDTEMLTGCIQHLDGTLDRLQTASARLAVMRAIQNLNGARKNIGPK